MTPPLPDSPNTAYDNWQARKKQQEKATREGKPLKRVRDYINYDSANSANTTLY